jgi:hypothetical protein
MKKAEFTARYADIVYLLREHSNLRFTEAGAREYETKREAALGMFLHLVKNATGVGLPLSLRPGLPSPLDATGIDSGSDPSLAGAQRLLKRASSHYRSCADPEAAQIAKEYELAAGILGVLESGH